MLDRGCWTVAITLLLVTALPAATAVGDPPEGLFHAVEGAGETALQHDAGSDRDAPDRPPSDLHAAPGEVHAGVLDPVIFGDPADVYALELAAGDTVEVAYQGPGVCATIWDPGLAVERAGPCSLANQAQRASFTADEAGTWSVGFAPYDLEAPLGSSVDNIENRYRFALAVDGHTPGLSLGPGTPS